MNTKLLCLSLFATALLPSCAVKFPDVKVHTVAGRFQAGMNWAYTGHDETGEIDAQEALEFLEGGALCLSSQDYLAQKNAIEEACYKLGSACSFEVKQVIQDVDKRIAALQLRRN